MSPSDRDTPGRDLGAAASASSTVSGRSRTGLLEKLMAVVRPAFRGDVLVFDPRDPVFGAAPCRVDRCERPARSRQMCDGHYQRWTFAGRPDLKEFVATTDPRMWGHRTLPPCRVLGCHYGRHGHGLCQRHGEAWTQAGRPDLELWLATRPPATTAKPPAVCRIGSCDLWTHAATPLCRHHARQWTRWGRPDIEEYVRGHEGDPVLASDQVDMTRLGPQLRLEMQYGLQRRRDEQRIKIKPVTVRLLVSFLAQTRVTSLLDRPEQTWKQQFPHRARGLNARSVLIQARRDVEDLAFGLGWDVEYPRDAWRLRSLGIDSGTTAHLYFDQIPQPWLKQLAKRWARWRLSTDTEAGWVSTGVAAVTRFARFLASDAVNVDQPAKVNRAVLERYLANLHTELGGTEIHRKHIGSLTAFFTAVRQHGWDRSLPATAVFYAEDYPQPPRRLPRALAEHVMTQLEDPDNLDRWGDPTYRLITIILMRCGLRTKDAVRLPHDCLVTDPDGAAYLRYYNHKMRREALVPIDEELRLHINDQQRRTLKRWPGGVPVLFPRRNANVDGSRPVSGGTYRTALQQWLRRCDIRDEHGQAVHLTPHQWRHTLGTRLINRDVPQEVVRVILDHDSHVMTAHYARLHDTTVRRHWEAAHKVNINGDTVTLDPNGPLAEAAWVKQRISRVTQALPNGYCGLPMQQTCPHANACLTCPMFVTTTEFLPQHRAHHQQTLQIISAAEVRGQTRVAEMNRHVADNLEKIITSLDNDHPGQQEATG